MANFSLAKVLGILRKYLRLRKMNARWIPHLLIDEQKRCCVLDAKNLLGMFPKYSKKSINNLVAGDGIWVYYYEPKGKCCNRVLEDSALSRKYCMYFSLTTRVQLCSYLFQRAKLSQEHSIEILF